MEREREKRAKIVGEAHQGLAGQAPKLFNESHNYKTGNRELGRWEAERQRQTQQATQVINAWRKRRQQRRAGASQEFTGPTLLFYGYGSQSCHTLESPGELK